MDNVKEKVEKYADSCLEEQRELLFAIGKIPSPSHEEDKRAKFCYDWFKAHGAEDVCIDYAKNVICRINCENASEYVVFEAHTDIVFPDTEELAVTEKDGYIYAPGIGDDTSCLVNLLMCTKFLLENHVETKCGLLMIANSCEEGLGNLDGTKAVFAQYGDKIKAFYSFDGSIPHCCNCAVGSYRYEVSCHTAGGHSYGAFGAPNAIEILCDMVERLYKIEPPTKAKTTFNVGRIEGGTTVNSIAQDASMLYEFRSSSQECLDYMERKFRETVDSVSERNCEISVKLLGARPGNGPVDQDALDVFTARSAEVISMYYDKDFEYEAASTDSNIPLSMGILANTVGTYVGGRAHTREEWMKLSSMTPGLKIALTLVLDYAV